MGGTYADETETESEAKIDSASRDQNARSDNNKVL